MRGVAWGTRRNDLTAANAAIAKHRLERATEDIKDMFVAGGFKGGNYLSRREHFIVSDRWGWSYCRSQEQVRKEVRLLGGDHKTKHGYSGIPKYDP